MHQNAISSYKSLAFCVVNRSINPIRPDASPRIQSSISNSNYNFMATSSGSGAILYYILIGYWDDFEFHRRTVYYMYI